MREDPVTEGLRRAAEVRAALTDEQRQEVDALVASVPDLFRRSFCGPPDKKGRQYMYYATEEEYQNWKEVNK